MRRNPDSHLDDITKRFAATSKKRGSDAQPQADPRAEFDDDSKERPSQKSAGLIMLIAIGALLILAVIGFLMLRA